MSSSPYQGQVKALFALVGDYVLRMDRRGRVLELNKAPKGFSVEACLGRDAIAYLEPASRRAMRKAVALVFRTRKPVSLEVLGQGSEGRPAWYLNRLGPVVEGGRVTSVMLISTPMSSESGSISSLPMLFARNPQPMWVYDAKSLRFLDVNEAAVARFGYPRRRFLSLSLKNLVMPEDRAALRSVQRRLGRGLTSVGLRRHRRADGTAVESFITTQAIEFQGRASRLSLIADASSQREAARKLNEAKELLSSVLANAPDYIYRLDRSGRITFANKVVPWLKLEQVIGRPLFHLLPADQRPLWRRKLGEVFRHGRVVGFDSLGKMTDGGRRAFSNRMAPLRVDGRIEAVVAETRDVTAHRRLEEQVERSQALLSSILTNVPDVVFVLDRRSRIAFINKVEGRCIEDVIGLPLQEIVARDERALWAKHVRSVLRTGRTQSFETNVRRPSGRMLWYTHRLTPVLASGKVQRVVVVCTDISERKNLELKLAQSERYWRTLLEQAPQFISCLDRRGRFLYVNRYAEGLTPVDVLGKRIYAFLHSTSRAAVRKAIERVFKTGKPVRLRTRGVADRGALAWYDSAFAPLESGHPISTIVAVASDVTQEVWTASRFQAMFDSSRDAIDYIGLDGTYLEVNPAFERLTGYSRDELLQQRRIYDLTPAEYRHIDKEAMRRLLKTGEPVEFEKEYFKKDGSRVPVNLTAFGVRGASGEIEGFAAVIKDITERRRLERELTEAGAREQSKLGRDLHDTLGQTVTGLSLLAKSLHGKLKGRGANEELEAGRLAELSALAVRQARGLARGLLPKELQAAGLAEALRQLAANAQELFGVACTVSLPAEPVDIEEATAVQLYRVAQEAVNNAAKHARSLAGVRLKLSIKGRTLLLEVADQGVGLPEPGRRGGGLGLSIMEHRARMIGGTLSVRRRPSGGTVVTCVCPLPRALQRSR